MDFIIIVLLVLAGIVIYTVRSIRKRNKAPIIDQIGMTEIDYVSVPFPNSNVKRSVIQLHTKYQDQKLVMHDVYQQNQSDFQIFLFDLQDQGRKEASSLAQDMIAVFSAKFNLPRLTILTRPQVTGTFGTIFEQFLNRLANWEDNLQGLQKISFPDRVGFDQRYMVFGVDQEITKAYLTSDRLDFLEKVSNHYAIDTGGDTFTLIPVIRKTGLSRRELIVEQTKDAKACAEIFK